MAGLVPAIHAVPRAERPNSLRTICQSLWVQDVACRLKPEAFFQHDCVDSRDKPGHDALAKKGRHEGGLCRSRIVNRSGSGGEVRLHALAAPEGGEAEAAEAQKHHRPG